jgi:hypothetical protein
LVAVGCIAVLLLLATGITPATGVTPATAGETEQDRAGAATEPRTPHQYVYVVYFNPADRECLPDYQERLDRVMTEIQAWYRDEMKRNGFKPMTFPLERDKDGRLVIHVVKSSRSYAYEERISTEEMRDNQVKPAMREKGIDIDQEHIIIFANSIFVTDKDGEKVVRSWSAYCGGGNHKSGTAWVTDFELLDPLNLPKKTPKILDGGKRPYTLGHYVVTYMGGVAHEFGHSLGLPHNMETEKHLEELGYALMGSGNYHLFGKRAGDEKESYLSKAHATILSSHPLFKRDTKDLDVEADCRFHDIEFASGDGEYIVRGRVEATPRPYAVVAYHDLMQHRIDYDSTSWVSEVDKHGRFEVHVGDLKPGWYEMRLRCYMVNGQYRQLRYRFTLNHTLKIPVEKLERQTVYEFYAKPAIKARDPKALLAAIEKLDDFNDIHYRRATAYHRVMTRTETEPQELSAIGDTVREVPLSSVKWESAEVGWAEPKYDHVDEVRPLESGEQFHDKGIYAHANSRYVYDLDGKWKTFTSGYGLQNHAEGSVVFVVKCDGKERFRSELMKDWVEGRVEIDLAGVARLELIVEDGGNGKWADCGIWFSPMLTR